MCVPIVVGRRGGSIRAVIPRLIVGISLTSPRDLGLSSLSSMNGAVPDWTAREERVFPGLRRSFANVEAPSSDDRS